MQQYYQQNLPEFKFHSFHFPQKILKAQQSQQHKLAFQRRFDMPDEHKRRIFHDQSEGL